MTTGIAVTTHIQAWELSLENVVGKEEYQRSVSSIVFGIGYIQCIPVSFYFIFVFTWCSCILLSNVEMVCK